MHRSFSDGLVTEKLAAHWLPAKEYGMSRSIVRKKTLSNIHNVSGGAAALLMVCLLTGCASGSFSSKGSGSNPTPPPPANTNPPSLPSLTTATTANDYVGTEAPGAASPENTVALHIDQGIAAFRFSDIAIPGPSSDPIPNSSGLYSNWLNYEALGDTSGSTGVPGLQYVGLTSEQASRMAFFASNSSQQLAAFVPKQSSSCITPTQAATYNFVTLTSPNVVPGTDTAWGSVQLSASGNAFSFTGAKQYTASSIAATTGLIPFGASSCIHSTANPGLGYFIDTAPTAAGTEIRAFLGPTGLLVANLQGTDSNGNPLPGVLGMVQAAAAIDLAKVTGSASSPVLYRTLVYQPQSSPVVQYGFFSLYNAPTVLLGVNDIFTPVGQSGVEGAWQSLTSFGNPISASSGTNAGAFAFGAQDASNAGLFPKAKFVYANTGACPTGTTKFSTGYCASPAVAIVGQHDGKYVILVTGLFATTNNTPMLLILMQE